MNYDKTIDKPQIPLTGTLVKSVIAHFSVKPYKGEDKFPTCSIGLGGNSIAATDGYSAILIGKSDTEHQATARKTALLECERANIYGEAVDLSDIETRVDNGKPILIPDVGKLIANSISGMSKLGSIHPKAMAKIGGLASTAGAESVELYYSATDKTKVGFSFLFLPAEGHANLLNQWEGKIVARGVVTISQNHDDEEEPELDESEATESEIKTAKSKKKQKVQPEPEVTVDTSDIAFAKLLSSVDPSQEIVRESFRLPALNMIQPDALDLSGDGDYSSKLIAALREFNISALIDKVNVGPTVSQYEIMVPPRTKGNDVAKLADDLQRLLEVESIAIQAPIPGKKTIGVEIPNIKRQSVSLRTLAGLDQFQDPNPPLLVALGLNLWGQPVFADLAKMPHLLIGGATNSGKSIGLATIITSLLMRNTPKELRLIMIDPKRVELSLFDGIPHLMCPVITDMNEAPGVLRAVWREMDVRYEKIKEGKARNIESWNEKNPDDPLPRIVVIIDELHGLMLQAKDEVETSISKLAAMARAVGIHLIVATQRPSVDVVTGLIKANIPSRISFATSSGTDSKVILDQTGAEKLLGRGDMLFSPVEAKTMTRIQGCYVSEEEVEAICNHWKAQAQPEYTLNKPKDNISPLRKAAEKAFSNGHITPKMLARILDVSDAEARDIIAELASLEIVNFDWIAHPSQKAHCIIESISQLNEILEGN